MDLWRGPPVQTYVSGAAIEKYARRVGRCPEIGRSTARHSRMMMTDDMNRWTHHMMLLSPRVVIRDTGTAKGRGVFTLEAVREGDIIEICPVIILEMPFDVLPEEVKKLVFDWGVLANRPGTHALALGYGSLYNDDNPANAL
jgi:hypothetical protein